MKPWLYAAFALFALAVLVLLAWGLAHDDEPGFEKTCWTADGRAVYGCKGGGPIRWPAIMPPRHGCISILVRSDSGMDADDAHAVRVVSDAADAINTRLGFAAFGNPYGPREPMAGAPVEVVWGAPRDSTQVGEGGATSHFHVAGELHARVEIYEVGTDELAFLVAEHELGHVLGLAHDPGNPQSIMRPAQGPTPFGEFPPGISDHDRYLLRALYSVP